MAASQLTMARDFPGTANNYISCSQPDGNITGTAVSAHCWVQPDSFASYGMPFTHEGTLTTNIQWGISIAVTSGVPYVHIGDSAGYEQAVAPSGISTGAWHALGLVKNGTGADALAVWVDGTRTGSTSNRTMVTNALGVYIGTRASGDYMFDGRIGECALWNVALTNAEMTALSKGVCPLLIRRTNLKIYVPVYGAQSPEPDLGSGVGAVIYGTVPAASAHPPVGRVGAFAG